MIEIEKRVLLTKPQTTKVFNYLKKRAVLKKIFQKVYCGERSQ